MVASLALVASFTALEVGVLALFGNHNLSAGVALAATGLGSLLGGVLFGHRHLGVRGLAMSMAVVAAGTALFGLVDGYGLQLAALFASGLGFAPALAALYVMVSHEIAEHSTAEAFGWLNSGALVGGALGTAVGGVIVDSYSPFAVDHGLGRLGPGRRVHAADRTHGRSGRRAVPRAGSPARSDRYACPIRSSSATLATFTRGRPCGSPAVRS